MDVRTARTRQIGTHTALGAGERAEIVSCWLEAHNARDIERMLVYASGDVEYHPLRLTGGGDVYLGHKGLRMWFGELERMNFRHELRAQELRADGVDAVVAIGSVDLVESPNIAEFCGVYRIADRLIASAHHRISDRQMMEKVGLLRPSPAQLG